MYQDRNNKKSPSVRRRRIPTRSRDDTGKSRAPDRQTKRKSGPRKAVRYEDRALRHTLSDIVRGHMRDGNISLEDAAKVGLYVHEGIEYSPLRTTKAESGPSWTDLPGVEIDDSAKSLLEDTTELDLGDGVVRQGKDYAYQEWMVFAAKPVERWVIPKHLLAKARKLGILKKQIGFEYQPERVTRACLEEICQEVHRTGGSVRRRLDRKEEKDGVR
uniref:Uncharacterized protein n=1 Tax=viral metagenome TaxID=1070528 RepID=A0A2V0RGS9_9ZZZZ